MDKLIWHISQIIKLVSTDCCHQMCYKPEGRNHVLFIVDFLIEACLKVWFKDSHRVLDKICILRVRTEWTRNSGKWNPGICVEQTPQVKCMRIKVREPSPDNITHSTLETSRAARTCRAVRYHSSQEDFTLKDPLGLRLSLQVRFLTCREGRALLSQGLQIWECHAGWQAGSLVPLPT